LIGNLVRFPRRRTLEGAPKEKLAATKLVVDKRILRQ